MSLRTIDLPEVVAEYEFPAFIELLGEGNDARRVELNFRRLRFMTPAGMVALTAKVAAWDAAAVDVEFVNYADCEAFRYLQRMNVFRASGYKLPEDFIRHDPRERFVPLRRISPGEYSPDAIATEVAGVTVPEEADSIDPDETGPYDYIWYGVSELASNVLHHSKGSGFVSAQYYPKHGMVRVALADCGIGIRRSFRDTPHWREGMTDRDSVELALRPQVSSKTHLQTMWGGPSNAGVGLTLLRQLSETTHGRFLVLSGEGYYSDRAAGNIREGFGFQGTLCAFMVSRKRIRNFQNLLYDVKVGLGLIQPQRGDHSEMFG